MSGKKVGYQKMLLVPAENVPEEKEEDMVPAPAEEPKGEQHNINALEHFMSELDRDMQKILDDKSLNEDEKLRRFLHTLRRYVLVRQEFEDTVSSSSTNSSPVPVRLQIQQQQQQQDQPQHDVAIGLPEKIEKRIFSKRKRRMEGDGEEEHEPVKRYKFAYSEDNILDTVPDSQRLQAKAILDVLKNEKNLQWDENTGEIRILNKRIPNSNIVDNLNFIMNTEYGGKSSSRRKPVGNLHFKSVHDKILKIGQSDRNLRSKQTVISNLD
jgi:hypothetical protein